MTTINFIGDASISNIERTPEGYLSALVKCARTGIQKYLGSELGLGKEIVRMYRPESVVFDRKNLATFVRKPATNDHPVDNVDKDNWKEHAVGNIGEGFLRSGEYVVVPLIIMEGAAISDIDAGKRELSMGYSMSFEVKDGVSPDGEPYDAIMTKYSANHIAIVSKGRAGSDVGIGDAKKLWIADLTANHGKNIMGEKKINVDGISITATDQSAQAIEKLQASIIELKKSNDAAIADVKLDAEKNDLVHKKEIADKDAELAKKDMEISEKDKLIVTDEEINKRVKDRAALISEASGIVPNIDFSEKSKDEIFSTVVSKIKGDEFVKDKSPEYVSTAYDFIRDQYINDNKDSFRSDMMSREGGYKSTPDDHGQSEFQKRLQDNWVGG